MALTKERKEQVIAEVGNLLSDSKLTVIAKYQGTSVKAMQQLRREAAVDGTTLRVVKNRLFKKAIESNDLLKDIDSSDLVGQLLYAFNSEDEVASARSLAEFAKTNPQIDFVAAITSDGQLLPAAVVKDLARLPTKKVLQAQLIGAIGAPVSSFVNVLVGNVRSILNILNAQAEALGE